MNYVGHNRTTKTLAQIKVMIKWDQRTSVETQKKPGDLCEVEY